MVFKKTPGDWVFDFIVYGLITLITVVMVYPFLYAVSQSISSRYALTTNAVWLFPVEPHFGFYKKFYDYAVLNIFLAYKNSLIYALLTAVGAMFMTALTAYPLTKKDLPFRKYVMVFLMVPMFFGGTFIQMYLLISMLGMMDTIWAIIVPSLLGSYNIVIVRTYFNSLPGELAESAKIDGAGYFRIFLVIILPLSKPVLAIIGMWSFVGQWNNYFGPLLYLNDLMKYPLTLVLQRALDFQDNIYGSQLMDFNAYADLQGMKAAALVVSFLPMMVLYPFVQKYFIKGVMVGSLKD